MTTSRIYAYRWPARLVSHKPFAAERYFITSSCIWQVFFRDFSEKIRFFFFIFFFWPPGSNFVQNAQFPEAPSGGKPEPPFQDAPKTLLLYKNPLRHRCAMPPLPKGEVLEANLSVCFADSSPNRGALGRPGKPCCSLGLNWAQGSGPCSHWQRLRDCALPKSAGQAVVNRDSGARSFPIAENFARSARPLPTRQWLPYQGSWHREAMTERLYQGTLSSKNRLLSQARLRGCTICHVSILLCGSRKATLRTTSPSPSVTPLLAGEALAFRKLYFFVFSRSARSSLGVM